MRGRWLAAVAVLAALVPGVAGVRADTTRFVACQDGDYSFSVPFDWYSSGYTCPQSLYASHDRTMVFGIEADPHSFWSAARAHSSLTGDIQHLGTPQGSIFYANGTVAAGRSYGATATVRTKQNVRLYVMEAQTFYRGYLYKGVGAVKLTGNAAQNAQRENVVSTILDSFQFSG